MNGLWRCVSLVSMLTILGCQGELPADVPRTPDPYAPCTDKQRCCATENLDCKGGMDLTGVTCTCRGLWDCSKNPSKCEADLPDPDGTGGWGCTWTEFLYQCSKKGSKGTAPDGYNNWSCKFLDAESKWVCKRNKIPNPTNGPNGLGVWKCKPVGDKLACERGVTPPPCCGGSWSCKGDLCTKKDPTGGLPPGGGTWKCHLMIDANGKKLWVCAGSSATPPGGGGWTCHQLKTEFGKTIYSCKKPHGPGDVPPGGGWYSCVKGTEFGGTKCVKVPKNPAPPDPEKGGTCKVGERLWCDGLIYCGWGQVECDPTTGKWKMKTVNNKQMLDCTEKKAGGKVPSTVCACYHTYYNPGCCERSDCIVPPGTSGQVCKPSPGKLCDPCNPMNPECKGAGAKCVVTNSNETFCGQDCSSKPCPAGYTCVTAQQKGVFFKQCIPADGSCYY